jgi:hypothetical protein
VIQSIFGAILASLTLDGGMSIRWVPDPYTRGATEAYVPDGYDCVTKGSSNNLSCWPSGTEPTRNAQFYINRGNTVFSDPHPTTNQRSRISPH